VYGQKTSLKVLEAKKKYEKNLEQIKCQNIFPPSDKRIIFLCMQTLFRAKKKQIVSFRNIERKQMVSFRNVERKLMVSFRNMERKQMDQLF
jgi:hypothetical protein